MATIQLVYASAANKAFTENELRDLLLKARANNSAIGVTGILLYHNRSFFQVLEGTEEKVDPLFEQIKSDPRHSKILLLSRSNIEHLNFAEWSMGFVDLDRMAAKLPGFVKLLKANSSFLELQGDSKLVGRLIDGFQDGKWRQSVRQ